MRKRKLEEVHIKEQSSTGIQTRLKDIADAALRESDVMSWPQLMEPLLDGVGDAAVLMAADGYGRGKVKGSEDGVVAALSWCVIGIGAALVATWMVASNLLPQVAPSVLVAGVLISAVAASTIALARYRIRELLPPA